MLYLTTRDRHDVHTPARTLAEDTAGNGGLFFPFQMPKIDCETLKEKSFGQCVADILNPFFSTHMTGKEVEFAVGRYPVKLSNMSSRIQIAELWRNLDGSYDKMEQRLAQKICGSFEDVKITSWLRIAIRIAVLFGVFGELMRSEGVDVRNSVDIAVPADDFSLAMAVWYGRQMGLPIANIICACQNNSGIWDLLHLGEMRVSAAKDKVDEFERLICGTLGIDEVLRYRQICERGGVYTLLPANAEQLRTGMFSAVVSGSRLENMIASVYRRNTYQLSPDTAAAYSGLMDYRTKTGEGRTALLLSDSEGV